MKYRVEFNKIASRNLKKLDKYTAKIITAWIRKNLEGCSNPRLYGKSLTGDKSGQWRYRVGNYRLIAEIHDEEILILVIAIGHRRDIYMSDVFGEIFENETDRLNSIPRFVESVQSAAKESLEDGEEYSTEEKW